jgi:hypothetical protein
MQFRRNIMATQKVKKEEEHCNCGHNCDKSVRKVHISQKQIKEMQECISRVEELSKAITKKLKKEKWVQNEYWEEDEGVMCASFINIDLDQLSVFFDRD